MLIKTFVYNRDCLALEQYAKECGETVSVIAVDYDRIDDTYEYLLHKKGAKIASLGRSVKAPFALRKWCAERKVS